MKSTVAWNGDMERGVSRMRAIHEITLTEHEIKPKPCLDSCCFVLVQFVDRDHFAAACQANSVKYLIPM